MRISKKDLEQRVSALEKRVIELQDTLLLMNKIQKNKYPFDINQCYDTIQQYIVIRYIDKGEVKTISYTNEYMTYFRLPEIKVEQINSICYLITVPVAYGPPRKLYFDISQGTIVDVMEEDKI